MAKHIIRKMCTGFGVLFLAGCTTVVSSPAIPLPVWNASETVLEAEYGSYLNKGDAQILGQAFLSQAGGGVVKAAGRNITLDPATTIGNEWWGKVGKVWVHRELLPPSPNFIKARRTVVADADGRFAFREIPAGKYYVRTDVTWSVGGYMGIQGGLVGQYVEVSAGENKEVILNQYPK